MHCVNEKNMNAELLKL
jgi:hypothetical protein